MSYQVLGPRILLKVNKIKEKDLENLEREDGTRSILIAPQTTKDDIDIKTTSQTLATVEQIGSEALTNPDYGLPNVDLKVGDKVHFQKYGAVRLDIKKHKDHEFWVINAKDLLVKETDE